MTTMQIEILFITIFISILGNDPVYFIYEMGRTIGRGMLANF